MKRIAIFLSLLLSLGTTWATSTINTTNQYAWGANIGWTNWRPDFDSTNTEGVIVGEFICSGYIYAANVGWINMGNGSPFDHIQYKNNSATDFGVNVIMYDPEYQTAYQTAHNLPADTPQTGFALLRGYAYGANIGWVAFETQGNPRVSLFTGNLSGYAYSANCGWINLNGLDAGAVPRFVQTDHIAMGVSTNGNTPNIPDAWEYLYFGSLLGSGGQSADADGDGLTNLQEYQDGSAPNVANSPLRITAYTTNTGGTSSNVTFTSTTARLYAIEVNNDLTMPLSWTDSGLGMFAPDLGSTTMKNVIQSSAVKRFYRAKTMRPLP
ncbi:MAG: hypothetical protein ACXWIU_00485 [Limisphaerales bacterium]